ncbi:MAG: universal stress protein [Pseudomonadota bacterium]
MYKTILVPVSFDEERDLDTAIAVAQTLAAPDAQITFLHVIELMPAYVAEVIPPEMYPDRRKSAETRTREIASAVEGAHAAVVDGPAGRTITTWARDNDADLIVVASHRPEMADIFLGSTAAWVVRHAPCSVHVVR